MNYLEKLAGTKKVPAFQFLLFFTLLLQDLDHFK